MRNKGSSVDAVAPPATPAGCGQPWALSVGLRLVQDGPVVLREPVTEADLADAVGECWLEGHLRRGRTDVELETLQSQVVPRFSESGTTCVSYTLEATDPGGNTARREFTIHSLEAVAARGAGRLLGRGEMGQGDLYWFEVRARRGPVTPDAAPAGGAAIEGHTRTRPIATLDVALAPLLETARAVGPQDDDRFRVLYTERAFEQAERLSRKGAERRPAVETGGVLVGSLARCPESGDLFVLVLDVLEAADADQQQFSLYYSNRTWGRIQAVMRAMQTEPDTRTRRIVGQCHGHNFIPGDGAPPCEACARLPVCGRSSVFVSKDDVSWARAVFRRQPWHLSHIFGLNARQERIHGLFGLRDGRLLERGFHVIADLETRED